MNDKNKQQKYVLICEQSSSKLKKVENDDYVFEGVFTEFGIENNNGRIYEEKEYLPHLEYLSKKIEKNMLVGELDHPEKFDVSYSKASHIIEKLEYNKEKRQIVGRIRLLNTRAGKDARALVDDNVQLSISSRAAGVVKEDKKVQLKRIFTYDLVNDPGFESANLTRVTESFGLPENSNIQIYEYINNKYDEENEKALDILIPEEKLESVEMENKNLNNKELQDIFSKIQNLENKLNEKDEEIKKLELKLEEQENKQEEYSNYVVEELKMQQGYLTLVAEHTDNLINFSDNIVENQRNMKKYFDQTTSKINEIITESDNHIEYMNLIMETLQESTMFSENIAEEVNIITSHSDHLTEGLNMLGKAYTYIKNEGLEKIVDFSEYIAENVQSLIDNKKSDTNNINNNQEVKENSQSLIGKIDEMIDAVKKQETARLNENVSFAYFNLLGVDNQNIFLSLPENQKQKVIEEVNKKKPVSENEFLQIWESVLNPTQIEKVVETLIKEMPNEYKEVWENLDEQFKNKILAQSEFYNLSNSAAIKNFWQTRKELNEAVDLHLIEKNTNTQKLNESQDYNNSLGYGNDHLQYIKAMLDKKFSNI